MAELSTKEENRLVAAIERAIQYANKGMEPTEAIQKVAEEEKYTPPFIERMAGIFNKSMTISRLKEAEASERSKPYPLADAQEVIRRIYTPVTIEKAAAFAPPSTDLSLVDMPPQESMQKAASSIDPFSRFKNMEPHMVAAMLGKCQGAFDRAKKLLSDKEAKARYELDSVLDNLVGKVQRLQEPALQKMAQLVTNGYPYTGKQFLDLLSTRARVSFPMVDKTANATVFPSEDVYFMIADAHIKADRVIKTSKDCEVFTKYAESAVDDIVDTVGNTVTGGADILKAIKPRGPEERNIDKELDPQYFNALKEVETRRAFMDLALYDESLNKHDMPTLIAAFNSAVSTNPEALSSPGILKTMMLQRINSGDIQDLFQATQETALTKGMRERGKEKREALAFSRIEPVKKSDSSGGLSFGGGKGKSESLLSSLLKKSSGGSGDKKDKVNTEDTKRDQALLKQYMSNYAPLHKMVGIPIRTSRTNVTAPIGANKAYELISNYMKDPSNKGTTKDEQDWLNVYLKSTP